MYIGSTGERGLAPPRLRGRGQLRRRGARRLLHRSRGDDPSRQLGHGLRQRARHSGRGNGERGQAGGRGRADGPALRRQVRRGRGYKVSGGLHGVGVSVVNALSERLQVEIRRDGNVWAQELLARRAAGRRSKGGRSRKTAHRHQITFLPDPEIFEVARVRLRHVEERLRETAFLTRGLKISIIDERGEGHARRRSITRAASRTSSPT